MATFTFEEQRVIIRFLHLHGMKPIEIHQQLSETCNDGVMDVKNVRSWVQQFKEGRTQRLSAFSGRHSRWCPQIQRISRHWKLYLFHSQSAVFHNHLFHSRNHVFRSASAWPRLLQFVFTRRSAFFELSYPRTHIFHVHNAIIASLTHLLMNFDGFHAT